MESCGGLYEALDSCLVISLFCFMYLLSGMVPVLYRAVIESVRGGTNWAYACQPMKVSVQCKKANKKPDNIEFENQNPEIFADNL